MTNNVFYIGGDEYGRHIDSIGTTGRGKTPMRLHAADLYAEMHSISREEALLEFDRVDEERQAEADREKEIRRKKGEKRLQAVKDAYWENSDLDEFDCIHDSCASLLDISPTENELKMIFDLLPEDIVALGIRWGFGDTEARDEVYSYIEYNQYQIRKMMGG